MLIILHEKVSGVVRLRVTGIKTQEPMPKNGSLFLSTRSLSDQLRVARM